MADLGKLTSPEAAAAIGPRTVALVPLGSTEPHGPHLPLDTDVTIALLQARRAAERLEALGLSALVLPAVPYGLTRFTEGFAGRITLRPGTLWALVEDLITSLEQEGVQRVVLVNGHLEPEHVKVLRGVVLDFSGERPGQARAVLADVTRRRFAETLGEEFRSGDCHAGRYETSLVLAGDPGSVREEERASLPEVRIGLLEKLRAGVTSFREAGAERAYCGAPAAASAAEGEDLAGRLADVVVQVCRETWPELFEDAPPSA